MWLATTWASKWLRSSKHAVENRDIGASCTGFTEAPVSKPFARTEMACERRWVLNAGVSENIRGVFIDATLQSGQQDL